MFAFLASASSTTALNPNEVINHAVGGLIAIVVLFGLVFLVGFFCWVVAQRRRSRAKQRRLTRSGIYEVDMMDGSEFERFLAGMFRRLGYGVQLVGGQGDFGADLLLNRNGAKVAVQAKCWSRTVGPGAVQEVLGARGYYACRRALVVANQAFTQAAQTLARANGVELWGRTELVAKMTYLNDTAGRPMASIPATVPAQRSYASAPAVAAAAALTPVPEPTRPVTNRVRAVRHGCSGRGAGLLSRAGWPFQRTGLLPPPPAGLPSGSWPTSVRSGLPDPLGFPMPSEAMLRSIRGTAGTGACPLLLSSPEHRADDHE